MEEAKLESINGEYRFYKLGGVLYLCRPNDIQKLTKKPVKEIPYVTLDKILHLGRSEYKRRGYMEYIEGINKKDVKGATGNINKINKNNLIICSPTFVSRHHAFIFPPDKEYNWYTIKDLNSKNGIFIDNDRIPQDERYDLRKGCEIRIGYIVLKFD